MTEKDFIDLHITKFTPAEVLQTGAALSEVSTDLLVMYQKYRMLLNRRVTLLPNGLTTGNHKSPLHPQGLAGDSALFEGDGPVDINLLFKAAISAGARGIGIYWNGAAYSTHLDIGKEYRFWSAYKKHGETEWKYRGLIIDPRNL